MRPHRTRSRGQAATDYLLVLALVALALSVGADAPVHRLVDAIAERYGRFVWSVSLP